MHIRLARVGIVIPIFLALASTLMGGGCSKSDNKSAGGTPSTGPAKGDAVARAGGGGGTIGVSLLTLGNPFFKEMGDAIAKAAAAKGYAVRIVSADLDPAKQRDQVRDFLTADCVAIILTPVDSKAVGTAIKDANDRRVPVFTADIACLDATAKVVSHVATDNAGGGTMAGEAAVAALGETGMVAILDHPEVESGQQRVAGFEAVLAKHPGIKVVAKLAGEGERDRSFRATQDILQSHPEVNLIFAVNDPSALGAVAALEGAGKLSQVKVIGFDGQPEARAAIRDGKMYADAVQHPDQIGAACVDRIARYLAGDAVDPKTLIPTALYRRADAEAELGHK